MQNSKIFIIVGAVLFLGLGYWLYQGASKPLPGEALSDLGQDHITDIAEVQYNSNPPTSGSHFPVWAKPGIYNQVISDGYLIHSLEHGYINISYNCDYKSQSGLQSNLSFIIGHLSLTAEAHEGEVVATESGEVTDSASSPQAKSAIPLVHMQTPSGGASWWSPENPPAKEVELPQSFGSIECINFVEQLKSLTYVEKRVILVPRPSLDGSLALTAWTRILKLNSSALSGLSQDDYNKAKEFIKAFNNKGPEKTME